MRFARVEFNNHTFVRKIDNHVLDAVYFHSDWPQLPNTFVTIFAFGPDLDRFDNRVIGTLGIMRVARFHF